MNELDLEEFESAYNRLFRLRHADTQHIDDCELVWRECLRVMEGQLPELSAYKQEVKDAHDLLDDLDVRDKSDPVEGTVTGLSLYARIRELNQT